MMGVAPQAGGVVPPASGFPRPAEAAPAPSPPARAPAPAREPVRTEAAAFEDEVRTSNAPALAPAPGASPADPLAGTVAVPVVAGPETEAALDDARDPIATPPPSPAPIPEVPSGKSPVAPTRRGDDDSSAALSLSEDRAAQTKPPRARAIAPTAALPQQPQVAATKGPSGSAPSQIRPLDVVWIVCTLGLYGVVLWFKRRKPT
jgi:hypothetical protein